MKESHKKSMLRVAVLTTDTLHHAFFIREISKRFHVIQVILETASRRAPFEVFHPFEKEMDDFEQRIWFQGQRPSWEELASITRVRNVNDEKTLTVLRQGSPEVVIAFGVGKIQRPLMASYHDRLLNLHGGDPEEYRGLDTHLWSIYHRDFERLVTTLHHLDQNLDTGDLILRKPIPLRQGMKLHELRCANTELCVELVSEALNHFEKQRVFPATPQRKKGRYYSFMPGCLKEICLHRFEHFTESLGSDAS